MTLYGGVYLGPQDSPFYLYLGVMLLLVQAMNIYWFNVGFCLVVPRDEKVPRNAFSTIFIPIVLKDRDFFTVDKSQAAKFVLALSE